MINTEDNPFYFAAIGGIIIGVATSLNYVFRGSVTGMSGMLYSTVTLDKSIFLFYFRLNVKEHRDNWRHVDRRWCIFRHTEIWEFQQVHSVWT